MKKTFRVFTVLVFAISLSIGTANAADLSSGLIGYWPLDGNANDTIGGNDGELVEGANFVNNGKVEGAVELDGSTGYIEIPDFELVTDAVTTVAWINGWRQTAWAAIVASRGGTTDYWVGFTDQDTLSYVWNDNSDQTWGWKDGPIIPENEWAMIAMAIEPEQATAYIYSGGELEQGVNDIEHIEQTIDGRWTFGWDNTFAGERHFQGIIDEVMIYERALSEDEVVDIATGGFAAVEPNAKLTTTWGKIKQ